MRIFMQSRSTQDVIRNPGVARYRVTVPGTLRAAPSETVVYGEPAVSTVEDHPVLVLGDNRDTLREVVEWVSAETGEFDTALAENKAIRLRRGALYELVILCAESVDESEQLRARLVTEFERDGCESLPTMVLLCKKQELREAYELCDTGAFDNYVLFRPIYDPFRLQLAIRSGLRYRRAQLNIEALRADMRAVGGNANQLDELNQSLEDRSRELVRRTRDRLEEIGADIGQQVEAVSRDLGPPPGRDVPPDWIGHIRDSLRQLGTEALRGHISVASDEFESWVVEWVDEHVTRQAGVVGTLQDTCADALRRAATILLVEDEPFSARVTEAMLARHGYQVVWASSGAEAIRQASSALPQLILLDLVLPDFGGDEVVRRLREYPQLRNVPVIVLSGVAEKATVENLVRLGIDGYQIKPPQEDRLVSQVQAILEKGAST